MLPVPGERNPDTGTPSLQTHLRHALGGELDGEVLVTGTADGRAERCGDPSLVGLVGRGFRVKFHRSDADGLALLQSTEGVDHRRVNVGLPASGDSGDLGLFDDLEIELGHDVCSPCFVVGACSPTKNKIPKPNTICDNVNGFPRYSRVTGMLRECYEKSVTLKLLTGGLTLNHKDYILTLKSGSGDLTLNAYSIKGIFNVKDGGCLTLKD